MANDVDEEVNGRFRGDVCQPPLLYRAELAVRENAETENKFATELLRKAAARLKENVMTAMKVKVLQ
jgi:hypothetical protein